MLLPEDYTKPRRCCRIPHRRTRKWSISNPTLPMSTQNSLLPLIMAPEWKIPTIGWRPWMESGLVRRCWRIRLPEKRYVKYCIVYWTAVYSDWPVRFTVSTTSVSRSELSMPAAQARLETSSWRKVLKISAMLGSWQIHRGTHQSLCGFLPSKGAKEVRTRFAMCAVLQSNSTRMKAIGISSETTFRCSSFRMPLNSLILVSLYRPSFSKTIADHSSPRGQARAT